jgi:16S rRNA (guanine527-N7)-methyltransferase
MTGPSRAPLPTEFEGLPALPDAFESTLSAGLDALGLTLPTGARVALDGYVRLLLRWTSAINLTAIREPADVARLHLLDSLAAVPLLRAEGLTELLDLGSGGGLPGIPIAIAQPEARLLLVDSVAKKARFLETAVAALHLGDRVAVATARAEDLARPDRDRGRWQSVLVRAVASLGELVELAFPLLAVDGCLVAWKREPLAAEIEAAGPILRRLAASDVAVHPASVPGLEQHRLVVIRKLRQTPPAYPRSPAERRRAPAHLLAGAVGDREGEATSDVPSALLRSGPNADPRPVGHPLQPCRARGRPGRR